MPKDDKIPPAIFNTTIGLLESAKELNEAGYIQHAESILQVAGKMLLENAKSD
ncbi:MAG: hypothetical protein R3250_11980 [Melioribacteraceae bacterium]|nr:hypothetical protein [Melioribacteraceae bacterium]